PPALFGTLSMIDLKKFLLKQKRRRVVQMIVMAPLAVAWVVTFLIDMVARNIELVDGPGPDPEEMVKIGGAAGGIIGAVIGVIVMIVLFRRMQRTNDTLISDIDDAGQDA
ncbi:MAG: hypothetical protein K2K93_04485, partial [Muribaculaceae bacterium]|nr:hypothetical protein [Muribaculaceae bacterium]